MCNRAGYGYHREENYSRIGTDGICPRAQSIQDAYVTEDVCKEFISPNELTVLNAAGSASENNILRICGYEEFRNAITRFKDYPFKTANRTENANGIYLAEGRKISAAELLSEASTTRLTSFSVKAAG